MIYEAIRWSLLYLIIFLLQDNTSYVTTLRLNPRIS